MNLYEPLGELKPGELNAAVLVRDVASGMLCAPRTVIRGESSEKSEHQTEVTPRVAGTFAGGGGAGGGSSAQAAITDYLNFTFPFPGKPEDVSEFVQRLADAGLARLGGFGWRDAGKNGYLHSFASDHGGALFAYGGQGGTAWFSLPGSGCALVTSWPRVVELLRLLVARITRWDGAADDYLGEHSVDDAVAWYFAGGFNAGGNRPKYRVAGDWLEPNGTGRTFYVGKRASGKLARIYEKGKQLGLPTSPWVRFEVEFHNVSRVIPHSVLLTPGTFVAGAYPCLSWVSGEASRIKTLQTAGQITYDRLCHHARVSIGRLLSVAEQVEGSPEAVLERLKRPGMPSRLSLDGLDPSHILNGKPRQ